MSICLLYSDSFVGRLPRVTLSAAPFAAFLSSPPCGDNHFREMTMTSNNAQAAGEAGRCTSRRVGVAAQDGLRQPMDALRKDVARQDEIAALLQQAGQALPRGLNQQELLSADDFPAKGGSMIYFSETPTGTFSMCWIVSRDRPAAVSFWVTCRHSAPWRQNNSTGHDWSEFIHGNHDTDSDAGPTII